MKVLTAVFLLIFSSSAFSAITVSWVPGGGVDGSPVNEWLLFCSAASDNYDESSPIIIPEADRSHTFSVPDGVTKCMMRSRSNNNIWNITPLDSANSSEVTFLVSGGVRVDPSPNAPTISINISITVN